MIFAVKTVEILFTWCRHERYTEMMETDFFSLNRSKNHTWKVTNVVMYSDTRADVYADPHINIYIYRYIDINIYIYINIFIYKYIYIYNSHLNCGNDKNQWFYNNEFGSYNSSRNNLLQYKVT